jgi:hypothetical protein
MSQPSTELKKILDEYSGRLSTYGEMYRNMHRNYERLKADQEHAKAVAKQAILTLISDQVTKAKESYEQKVQDLAVETLRASKQSELLADMMQHLADKGCVATSWVKQCWDCEWMVRVEELTMTPINKPELQGLSNKEKGRV